MLARGVEGYHRLAAAITEAQLRGDEKGRPLYDLEELADQAGGHWLILTGCRKGAVRAALAAAGPAAAAAELDRLTALFGHDRVAGRADRPGAADRLDRQRRAGRAGRRPRPAAGGDQQRALRDPGGRPAGRRDGRRPGPAQPGRDGRLAARGRGAPAVGAEMARAFARYPGAVARRSSDRGPSAPSTCSWPSPGCPSSDVPLGHTPISWLRELCRRGADERYRTTGRKPRRAWQRKS